MLTEPPRVSPTTRAALERVRQYIDMATNCLHAVEIAEDEPAMYRQLATCLARLEAARKYTKEL